MADIEKLNEITHSIIGCAISVHQQHGPGLLESAYECCLASELQSKGHKVQRQVLCPLKHNDVYLPKAFRVDLIVDALVIVEIKAVERLLLIHRSQILHYMHLLHKEIGLLINFRTRLLKHGIQRYRLWECD